MNAESAAAERQNLIDRYVKNPKYSDIATQASGINHIAFVTKDIEATIEFYVNIVGLKLLRIRPLDHAPESTMVFFDLGQEEVLAFLKLADVDSTSQLGIGGVHHFALNITHEQYEGFRARAEAAGIPYNTIKHEILTSISALDPNGLEVELSVWNIRPEEMAQNKEVA